jgi:hypothetical protein
VQLSILTRALIAVFRLQGVIVALAGLYAASACFWRPFLDPIYTIYEIATALAVQVAEFTLVVAIQIDLSGYAEVPVEFLLSLSFAAIMANVGKQASIHCCPDGPLLRQRRE